MYHDMHEYFNKFFHYGPNFENSEPRLSHKQTDKHTNTHTQHFTATKDR